MAPTVGRSVTDEDDAHDHSTDRQRPLRLAHGCRGVRGAFGRDALQPALGLDGRLRARDLLTAGHQATAGIAGQKHEAIATIELAHQLGRDLGRALVALAEHGATRVDHQRKAALSAFSRTRQLGPECNRDVRRIGGQRGRGLGRRRLVLDCNLGRYGCRFGLGLVPGRLRLLGGGLVRPRRQLRVSVRKRVLDHEIATRNEVGCRQRKLIRARSLALRELVTLRATRRMPRRDRAPARPCRSARPSSCRSDRGQAGSCSAARPPGA